MKKITNTLLIAVSVLFIASCSKTQSPDPPLPKDRYEAVYVTTDNNNLISYEANNGTKLWEVILNGKCEGTPVLYNKKLYVHTKTGFLYKINILNGEIDSVLATFAMSNLALCVANGKIYTAADKLYCYDTTFDLKWTYDGGNLCSSSPQFHNNKIFLGINDKIHCVDINGNNVWQSPGVTPGGIVSSPRVSNGKVFYGGQDKKIYAINESDGSPVYNYLTLDKVESSPLIYGGMCIIGSNDYNVYCIDTLSGLLRWKHHTAERVISSPNIHTATNTVLVGSYDFNLYAIDHVSGALKWKYPAGSLIKSSPVVYGNLVYFTSFDRYLYCVDARNGSLIWKQFINANSQGSPIVDDLNAGLYATESGMSIY